MEAIPHVIGARHLGEFVLEVTFANGAVKKVDFEPYAKRGGVFAPLADLTYFKRFFIDLNTVCWPNGADVAPERLYEIGEPLEAAA